MAKEISNTSDSYSTRSLVGLNSVNFFLAELAGVIGPFLVVYLKQKNWSYADIGIASAAAGLGTLLAQTPAGYFCDRVQHKKTLLAFTSVILGICFAVLPSVSAMAWVVDVLLFVTGIASAFFVPLLASLALSLVGPKKFPSIMGQNQAWNHAGNIVAALTALVAVQVLGIQSIFYITAIVSWLAVASLTLLKSGELKFEGKSEQIQGNIFKQLPALFKNPQTRCLLLSVALFHLANAPVLPLVGLYLKSLGAADDKVAWTVVVAQVFMIPVAYLAAKYGDRLGRKPVFAVAFAVLPLRIVLYTLTQNQNLLLAIQALDGIGAGIYGVVIAVICRDITSGKTGFNLLMGLAQTALAVGGFLGPLTQGFVTEHFGFPKTFIFLAVIALMGLITFITQFKETKSDENSRAKNELKIPS